MTLASRQACDAVQGAVARGATPGAVLCAGWGPETEVLEAFGWAERGSRQRAMTTGTLFDLASLTKVVATLPVLLQLIAAGEVSLGDHVAELLPGFGAEPAWRSSVTVEHLLTHTAGLPAFREHWRAGLAPCELRHRLLTEPLLAPPGERVVYSDIGFMLLGWLAEALTGRPLDALVAAIVAGPLGLGLTGFGPRMERDVAATELRSDGRYHVGAVHDETAAALGAPAGHAGLFSTAADLGGYLAAWTGRSGLWLPRSLREAAASDRTAGLGGHRGLGWAARHDSSDQLGDAWPESAVSHSGFTGTSLALDMPSGRWVVQLTNDVHFGRGRGVINPLRRAVHTALAP